MEKERREGLDHKILQGNFFEITLSQTQGLGTSTTTEAREYFSALGKHKKEFKYDGAEDDKALKMAFANEDKKSADLRKEWLDEYKPGTYLDQSKAKIPIKDFVMKELVLYGIENCQRSIPALVDGFKPGQRKILFACFKRNLTKGALVLFPR